MLADAIHGALPQDECEYFGVSDKSQTMSGLFSVPMHHRFTDNIKPREPKLAGICY